MAGDAGGLQLLLVEHAAMTRLAAGLPMLATQAELRLAIVIETAVLPAADMVTTGAFVPEAPLMAFAHVVVAMATGALPGCFLVLPVLVACITRHTPVFVLETETRLIVIEPGSLPVAVAMAVLASGAQAAFVHVILAMTGLTLRRGIAKLRLRQVT